MASHNSPHIKILVLNRRVVSVMFGRCGGDMDDMGKSSGAVAACCRERQGDVHGAAGWSKW